MSTVTTTAGPTPALMKEINAAYAEFKRHWNGKTAEGARVG